MRGQMDDQYLLPSRKDIKNAKIISDKDEIGNLLSSSFKDEDQFIGIYHLDGYSENYFEFNHLVEFIEACREPNIVFHNDGAAALICYSKKHSKAIYKAFYINGKIVPDWCPKIEEGEVIGELNQSVIMRTMLTFDQRYGEYLNDLYEKRTNQVI